MHIDRSDCGDVPLGDFDARPAAWRKHLEQGDRGES
jgi:hypothetical protein